jgi:hypothetical protein
VDVNRLVVEQAGLALHQTLQDTRDIRGALPTSANFLKVIHDVIQLLRGMFNLIPRDSSSGACLHCGQEIYRSG